MRECERGQFPMNSVGQAPAGGPDTAFGRLGNAVTRGRRGARRVVERIPEGRERIFDRLVKRLLSVVCRPASSAPPVAPQPRRSTRRLDHPSTSARKSRHAPGPANPSRIGLTRSIKDDTISSSDEIVSSNGTQISPWWADTYIWALGDVRQFADSPSARRSERP